MINNNYINAENNYSIDIDLETGKFSCRYTLKGRYNNKQYPLGTTRTEVVNELENMFNKQEKEDV